MKRSLKIFAAFRGFGFTPNSAAALRIRLRWTSLTFFAVKSVLVVVLSSFWAFGCSPAELEPIPLPPGYQVGSIFCTCSCGLFLERADTPTFEVCLPPERVQEALDGAAFSQREVHNSCSEICRNGVTQGARNYSCELGQVPCEGPFCLDCRALPLDSEGFFFEDAEESEADAGFFENDGGQGLVESRGIFGVGLGLKCKDEGGDQFACDVEECAQDALFTPRCGDQVLQPGEICDGECGTFPSTCDIRMEVFNGQITRYRGRVGCSEDCQELLYDQCIVVAGNAAAPTEPPICPTQEERMKELVLQCGLAFSGCNRRTCLVGEAPL